MSTSRSLADDLLMVWRYTEYEMEEVFMKVIE